MHMVQIATMIYNSFQISHIFTHRLKIGSNSFHLVFHSKQFWEPNLMPKALARKELGKARCSAVQGLGAMRCQICPLLVRLSPLQILQVLQMCLFCPFFFSVLFAAQSICPTVCARLPWHATSKSSDSMAAALSLAYFRTFQEDGVKFWTLVPPCLHAASTHSDAFSL